MEGLLSTGPTPSSYIYMSGLFFPAHLPLFCQYILTKTNKSSFDLDYLQNSEESDIFKAKACLCFSVELCC